ncbi:MAG: hypothetical protein MUP09_08500 [Thiovulaceae bacterium]|nr:hypothetical protein [Sulfurimonadaceae bacterium]
MNTRLHHTLLTLSLAAFMMGCGTTSDSTPLVPEIVSIEIDGTDVNSSLHSIIIDQYAAQLNATVSYDDSTSAYAADQLYWESNDTTVVTVLNGLLTPVANGGTAAISASYRDNIFTTKDKNIMIIPLHDINITSAQDINITADDTNSTLYHLDINTTGVYTLQSYGTFDDNQTTIDPISNNIQWKSSNTSVATVGNTTGILTIIASGTADVNVSVYNEINSTLELNVSIR